MFPQPKICSRQPDFIQCVGDMLDKWKKKKWKAKAYRQEMFIEKENKIKRQKNGWEAQHTELRIKKTSYILP